MPGQFFEHESQVSFDTCPCIVARNEGDHSTPEKHWQTSVFVLRCPAHKEAGSTAAQAHQGNMAKNVALAAFLQHAPPDAAPFEYLLSPATRQIAIRHPDADHAAIAAALDAHPHANLVLADSATTAAIFAAHDASPFPTNTINFASVLAGAVK